jgi:hypothetical protein
MWQRGTGSNQTGCQIPVVPDLVRPLFPILLAARLRQIERLILGADGDHLSAIPERQYRGDIARERGVPAVVPDHQPAIDPDVGPIVDRPEMEHQLPAAVGRRDLHRPSIPDHRVIPGVADPACPRLRRERDDHCPVKWISSLEPARIQPDVGVVIGESPGTAEIDPAVTCKLRTRMELGTVLNPVSTWIVKANTRSPAGGAHHPCRLPDSPASKTDRSLMPSERHCPPVSSRGTRDLVGFVWLLAVGYQLSVFLRLTTYDSSY